MSTEDSRPIIVPQGGDAPASPPFGAGKASAGQKRRRRFYKLACAVEDGGLWRVELDGRSLKTPGRSLLAHPARALMEAVAAEWAAQGEEIDTAALQFTRLVNTAMDGVRGREDEVTGDILRYAGSDLVLYRADAPAELREQQDAAWDGVLAWAEERHGAVFTVAAGIMPVEQPPGAVDHLRPAFTGFDAFALTALHCMTTLTGSALLTLAHAHGRLTLDEAWQAAHVDEDYQIERWGWDAEAQRRRRQRLVDMTAASRFFEVAAGR
jgi:chaperone required for assembly of F1-ATPase